MLKSQCGLYKGQRPKHKTTKNRLNFGLKYLEHYLYQEFDEYSSKIESGLYKGQRPRDKNA